MTNANTKTKQSLNYGQKNTKLDNDFKEINHNMSLTCPIHSLMMFWKSFEKWAS